MHYCAGYPQGTKFWIGGNDLAQNGRWVWSRGRLIQGYVNYANYGQDQSGHCLEARSPSFQWFRSSCHGDGGSHAFLVEKGYQNVIHNAGGKTFFIIFFAVNRSFKQSDASAASAKNYNNYYKKYNKNDRTSNIRTGYNNGQWKPPNPSQITYR